MRKLIFIFLLLPVIAFCQFDQSRISYDVEFKLKPAAPDTVIKIDSTGTVNINTSWGAVSAFDEDLPLFDYDLSGGWVSIVSDYKETKVSKAVQIENGVYSFRVWSKYVHKSGNVMRSLAPSPEYFVEFQLTEKAPQRVMLRMRFDSN